MTARILHIIPTLDQGGAEKQLCLLAGGLRADWETHVCTLTRTGPLAERLAGDGIPLTNIGKRWKIDPGAYWRLKRHIRFLRPSVVHTWLFAANCYGRRAARDAGVRRIVAGERCVDQWKAGYQLAIDRWLARFTDRIVANSPGVRDFYVHHGLPVDRIVVIPNAIENRPEPPDVARPSIQDELQLPAGARIIATIGRLWPQKRHKDLIWAAELLRELRGDTHLLIAGEGPLRQSLVEYRDQLDLARHVHFLGHRADVDRLLRAADVFWLASGYEGQSNAIMEAMLAGVPVVATDIPGNRDLIVHERCGFLVPLGDRAEFARRTNRLLDDSGLASSIGRAAQARMRTDFTVEKMVARHHDLYSELVR